MKKLAALMLLFVLFISLFSCKENMPLYEERIKNGFSATLNGTYNGQKLSLSVSCEEKRADGTRDFFAELHGGALDGVIISHKNSETTVGIGQIKDIPFPNTPNDLVTLSAMLSPDSIESQKRTLENGEPIIKISAVKNGVEYTILADQNAIPIRILGDNLDLTVSWGRS